MLLTQYIEGERTQQSNNRKDLRLKGATVATLLLLRYQDRYLFQQLHLQEEEAHFLRSVIMFFLAT